MKLPLTGGCQCGALRYEIRAEPLTLYVCHCTECQRQSAAVSIVKPGTLDDTSWLHPVGHIWTNSAQPWVTIPQDTVIHEAHPADVSGLIAAWTNYRATMQE
jgi:hypothetical protein